MQNHYNLLYREEEREMFPTLKVRPSFLSKLTILTLNTFFSTWALVQFPGPLLLAVFLPVLMETIRSAQRMISMEIDLGSQFPKSFNFFSSSVSSKAMARMQERKKLSTGKLIYFDDWSRCNSNKIGLRRSLKLKVLAWRSFRLHGSWVKKVIIFPSTVLLLFLVKYDKNQLQGVSAPIVGTTSLENLYDLLGRVVYFNSPFRLLGT